MEKFHTAAILCLHFLRTKSPVLKQEFEIYCNKNDLDAESIRINIENMMKMITL